MKPLTAAAIAEAVRSGHSSATIELDKALARISRFDGQVGAFQIVRAERALAEAAELDARADRSSLPLAGVPVAIKDNIPVAGEPLREGSAATSSTAQRSDHEVVRRLRKAGAIVVGLTRVPELCVFAATDSVYGITRNPWNRSLTAGGSSGGAAAAVSSGQVTISHGNDGMGSIRIPAANCGLVGLKPGRDIIPQNIGVNSWLGMSENGPLATTVADAALMFSVMAARPDLSIIMNPATTLRIAVAAGPATAVAPVDPEWARGVAETADALRMLGHLVTETTFPYPWNPLPLLARWFAGTKADADLLDFWKLEPRTRTHVRLGALFARAARNPRPVETFRETANRFFDRYDVLITPSLAQPGIPAVQWHTKTWLSNLNANIRYAPFASPWNLLGWPACSIPTGTHASSGTPLGVQLVTTPAGRGAGEARLLSLAAQLEQLRPWQRVAPGFEGEAY